LADHNGHLKRRPAIIISPTDEIEAGAEIAVMAISTSYPAPPPANCIELPWNNDRRRSVTRLSQRSAAVTNWLRYIREEEIDELAGDVPLTIMVRILSKMG
jgi:hypothetical protein